MGFICGMNLPFAHRALYMLARVKLAGRSTAFALVAALGSTMLVAGCGGGDRQDKDEKAGSYEVQVVDAKFPAKQTLAKQVEFSVQVKNTGREDVPNIAVTLDSFAARSDQPGLADPERPVWIIDSGPRGGTTAYTNTWALGALRPGEMQTFTWRVTAVRPGTHKVNWQVAAGLDGKAKAVPASGSELEGSFTVDIAREPAQSRVDPDTGDVIREGEESS